MERNIALRLSYTGTAYHGWQVQKNAVSVAETLEKALSSVVCRPVKVTGAGRTDAGVHAQVYVANFRTTSGIPVERLPLAVNTRLPDDISVFKATVVPGSFNAIGSCLKKEYTYKIYNSMWHMHPGPIFRQPGVVLPQATGREGHGPGGRAVCRHPRLCRRPLGGHRDPHHRAHRPLF